MFLLCHFSCTDISRGICFIMKQRTKLFSSSFFCHLRSQMVCAKTTCFIQFRNKQTSAILQRKVKQGISIFLELFISLCSIVYENFLLDFRTCNQTAISYFVVKRQFSKLAKGMTEIFDPCASHPEF